MIDAVVRAVKGGAIFGFIGPLVGYAVFLLMAFIQKPDLDMLSFALIPMAFFAYLFGAVPAIVTGLIAGLLHPWIFEWRGYLLLGVLGGALTCVIAVVFSLVNTSASDLLFICFIPGCVAASVCARVNGGPPNNSFKPKPLRGSA